jgi:1-acyl-sn-glycerol-3-phosphate acyltransferase
MKRPLPLTLWLAYWRYRQYYHRYRVYGFEQLAATRPAMLVGYHGSPLAYDLCMLTVAIYDRFAYMPATVVHRGVEAIGLLRWLSDGLGFVTGDGERLRKVLDRGQHIIVSPGGSTEGARSFCQRYTVDWGKNTGYLKLAAKQKIPMIPVGAWGVDHAYIGLNDSPKLGRALGLPKGWEWLPWIGVGLVGVYPLAIPFPVQVRQIIGKPIAPPQLDGDGTISETALREKHAEVQLAVQALLNEAATL